VAFVISNLSRNLRVTILVMLGLLVLISSPLRGDDSSGIDSPALVTNISQLRKLVARDWRVRCDLALEGVVCSVSSNRQVLVLADASGAELLSFDFAGKFPAVGQRISLAGKDCEITRRREGLALGRAPVLENDGLHGVRGVSATIELAAGWHPIQVEWFNAAQAAELSVSHTEPGGESLLIADSKLSRLVKNDQIVEPGLNFASYEGGWSMLPDFGLWPVKETGVARNFDLSVRSRSNHVGLVFKGWLRAERSGPHSLSLRSDDGSRLLLGPPVPTMTILGKGALPTFRQYFIGQVVNDSDAYVWARAHGDVRRVELRDGRMELELRSPREGRLLVEIVDGHGVPPELLVNNRVSILGVSRKVIVPGGQQIYGLVSSASLGELQLLEAAPEVWAANPVKNIAELTASPLTQNGDVIVRLRGKLERAQSGGALVLRDATGVLAVSPGAAAPRNLIGNEVEVLSYCRPTSGEWSLELGFFRAAAQKESAQTEPMLLLTTAEEVLRLKPAEAARSHPVRLRGVITCLWPDYQENAILQDATRGVFLRLPTSATRQGLQVGDFWEVEGTTAAGSFAPILTVSNLTRQSEGRLPEPVRPAWDQLINGSLDAQYVEIEGIIIRVNDDVATLLTHWGKVDVQLIGRTPLVLEQYENRLVRLRGTLLASWDDDSRQIRVGELRLASATISTTESGATDPFTAPLKTLGDLLRFDIQASVFQRVRLAGQVLVRRGDEFFVHTPEGGFRFFSKTAEQLVTGDWVEVSGFPQLEGPSPVLREAVVRRTHSAELPRPRLLGPGNFNNADNDALRVRCEATLVSERRGREGEAILELQSGLRPFVVRTTFKAEVLQKISSGSRLEVTGVFVGLGTSRMVERKLEGFELLVETPDAIRVVAQPPWWTLRRLLAAVGILIVVLAAAMLWVFQLRRRVEAQTLLIRQKVEHEATLEERTRIARELHDTLEQALAGISFQLGALAGMMRELPQDTTRMLDRARMMVKHGQEEARRTVRNLRMLALEGGDFQDALLKMANDTAEGTAIEAAVHVHGNPVTLTGKIENHLLRIAQEAMTNAVKHGAARRVQFELSYTEQKIELKISDDGRGFDPDGTSATEAGHFGLLGMRERANKMGGVLNIASSPGNGTVVTVQFPQSQSNLVVETK
jgi:signal transduction histidine kinase